MSYFLRNRGFEVIAYTIEPKEPSPWNLLLREANLNTVYGTDTIELPFDDASFDTILACGVLEHVEDELLSRKELVRVLLNRGLLILMMLPNRWSWAEFLARRLPRRGHHDRLYTQKRMKDFLAQDGFYPIKTYRMNVIPKNLEGVPERVRQFIGSYPIFCRILTRAYLSSPHFLGFPVCLRVCSFCENEEKRRPCDFKFLFSVLFLLCRRSGRWS